MASITLRVGGSTLTFQELDDNFTNINNELPDALSYDSATSTVIMGRIGTSNFTADLTPITEELINSATFARSTNTITLDKTAPDLTIDIGDIVNKAIIDVTATGKTMVVGTEHHLTGATQTMTLPTNVTGGERTVLAVRDFRDTTIDRNGNKIMGIDSDMSIDVKYSHTTFTFVDSAWGWSVS